MGVTFGQMEGLEMPYERVGSRNYEVRRYDSYYVAEMKCNDDQLKSSCQALERYFGCFCEPENVKGSPIASVTPHIASMSERIPMRLPVLREKNLIQFVLPAIYSSYDHVPVPTNPLIHIRHVPERYVAVHTFYGQCLRPQYEKMLHTLFTMLQDDHMLEVDAETERFFARLSHRKGPLEPLLTTVRDTNGEAMHNDTLIPNNNTILSTTITTNPRTTILLSKLPLPHSALYTTLLHSTIHALLAAVSVAMRCGSTSARRTPTSLSCCTTRKGTTVVER